MGKKEKKIDNAASGRPRGSFHVSQIPRSRHFLGLEAMEHQRNGEFFTQFLQIQSVDNDQVMATPALAQDVNGLPVQKAAKGSTTKFRGDNYSDEEDKILVNVWLCISLDGIIGNGQKFNKLWDRIHGYYHEGKKPNHPERSTHSLSNRWSVIRGSVNKFCGCFAQIEYMNPSGCNEADKIKMARATYKDTWDDDFQFDHCWEILRSHPKWVLQKEQGKTKRKRVACDSQTTSETIDIDEVVLTKNSDQCERPPGRKAQKANEKKRKSQEEKSALFEKVVSSLKEERKQQHGEKMEKIDKLAQIEEKKVELMEKRLVQEEKEKMNQIMLMDISGLDVVEQEYFQKTTTRNP